MPSFHRIPVVSDRQGVETYYIGSIKAGLLAHLLSYKPDFPADVDLQRDFDPKHAQTLADYVASNPDLYVFGCLEIAIFGDAKFTELQDGMGYLEVEEGTPMLANDGMHRGASYSLIIQKHPAIARHGAKVCFRVNPSYDRCQQVLADLNQIKKVPTSLKDLFDGRDPDSAIARHVRANIPLFKRLTATQSDSLSKGGSMLFTFNGLKQAVSASLYGQEDLPIPKQAELAARYWSGVVDVMEDWQLVFEGKADPAAVRKECIHCQAVILIAIGRVGSYLLQRYPIAWQQRLKLLSSVDWSRDNPTWRGRVVIDGSIRKSQRTIMGATNYLKLTMELKLSAEEQELERLFSEV